MIKFLLKLVAFLSTVLLFGYVGVMFSSCTTVSQVLKTNVAYKKDIKIEANGHQAVGTLVLPKAATYKMELESYGKLDLFTLTSCHREITKEEAGDFWNKKKTKLEYKPVAGIETDNCTVNLGGYDIKGRHSWGLIDFESDNFKLPALVRCNGNEYNANGVSLCQSRVGLIEQIVFAEDVTFVKPSCMDIDLTQKRVIEYRQPEGECVILFKGIKGQYHKHTVFGYSDIVIREL